MVNRDSKIYVAGNTGLVGSALCRCLHRNGYKNQIFTPWPEWDLREQWQTREFFTKEKPEYVFLAAAKVGGIVANNTYPAEFIYDNLMIESNIIHAAHENGVSKLLFLGSSCIYPKLCPQPIREEYLLTGSLEPTNEAYAIAKIAGLKMCEFYKRQYGDNFISAMPTNLYGPNDNFHLERSHVLPAMVRKFHLAKLLQNDDFVSLARDFQMRRVESSGISESGEVSEGELKTALARFGIMSEPEVYVRLWGTGNVLREFLYVDDLADALLHLMLCYEGIEHVNVGVGYDLTIRELAEIVAAAVGFSGKIEWDSTKPDGTPRKLLDVSRLKGLGWRESVNIEQGIARVYESYLRG